MFLSFLFNFFGAFTILYFVLFFLLVVSLIFVRKKYYLSIIGLIFLTVFFQIFLRDINEGVNSGYFGFKVINFLNGLNIYVKYFFYYLLVLFSTFLLFYAFKDNIVLFIGSFFKRDFIKKDIKMDFANKNKFYDRINSDSPVVFSKADLREKSKKVSNLAKKVPNLDSKEKYNKNKSSLYKNIPWISKIIYEKVDKRIEIPVFSSDHKVIKFKLKENNEDYSEYDQVDTFSNTFSNEFSDDFSNSSDQIDMNYIKNRYKIDFNNRLLYDENIESNSNTEVNLNVNDDFDINNDGEIINYDFISYNDLKDSIFKEFEDNEDQIVKKQNHYYFGDEEIEVCESDINDIDYIYSGENIDKTISKNNDVNENGSDSFVNNFDYNDNGEVEEINGEVECLNCEVEDIDSVNELEFKKKNLLGINGNFGKQENKTILDSEKIENFEIRLPDENILINNDKVINKEEQRAINIEDAKILEETLMEFDIKSNVCEIISGPVVTLFKLVIAPGVKLSKIESLSDNIALRLGSPSVRIIAPIPGEKVVGIEVPNRIREIVSFKDVVTSKEFENCNYHLPVALGKDIYGKTIVLDIHKMPHILIAGATGAGKSVCVNVFLGSLLFKKDFNYLKLMLIDPKIVELQPYDNIPHLITPVITDSKDAVNGLKYLVYEMEERYNILAKFGVRDIVEYRKIVSNYSNEYANMPFIVCFVDEFADLLATSGKEVELLFARLTAKARAVGIHLVLATQRPSTDVITGLIKANVPARIAFQVISYQDSRIILDQKGAEKLLGQGDMLYLSPTQPFPVRLQGAYLSKEEVDEIANYWKEKAKPDYVDIKFIIGEDEEEEDEFSSYGDKDPLYEDAINIVIQSRKASASYLQRRLNIGYNRAARLIEMMEEEGIVGPMQGSKPREIYGR